MPASHASTDGSPPRSRTRTLILRAGIPAGVLGLVAAAVAVTPAVTGRHSGGGSIGLGRTQPVAFQQFSDCTSLLRYYQEHAARTVTPYGLPGDSPVMAMGAEASVPRGAPVPAPMAAPDRAGAPAQPGTVGAASPAQAADGTTSATGTNVQVAGVDEADIAKVDGDLLVTVTGDRLHVARIGAGRVHPLGSLAVNGLQPADLLVDGDTALLIGDTGPLRLHGPAAEPDMILPRPLMTTLRLTEVDLSDPAHPRVTRTLDIDGTSVGARLVGGVARIAVNTDTHRLLWVPPTVAGETAAARALAANRRLLANSSIGDWLPGYTLTRYGADGRAQGTPERGRLLDCAEVAAPVTFSGLSTLSLLSVDLRSGDGIGAWTGAGVVASGATLYATAEHTYVTTTPWVNWAGLAAPEVRLAVQRQHTQVHLFDTPGSGAPRYVASGSVPGVLLGQFALDEYGGRLRVASTEQPAFVLPPGAPMESLPLPSAADGTAPAGPAIAARAPEQSQSMVSVLAVRGRQLVTVGSVGGLGRGETIRAVRFIGPVGYVVTFRQTDPLYTLDLSRPDRPRVAGELKLLGYSAYLHPVGDGLLLGLGQAADSTGATSGLQMSLFDVSDPAAPRRLAQVRVTGAYSDAEGDHHAFTFADGLALAPYTRYGLPVPVASPPPPASDSGAAGTGSGSAGFGSAEPGSAGSGSAGTTTPTDVIPASSFDAGVLAVRVQGDRLSPPVSLRPMARGPITINPSTGQGPDDIVQATPLRTVVVDGFIYTVTPVGIAVHDATTLQRVGFTPF